MRGSTQDLDDPFTPIGGGRSAFGEFTIGWDRVDQRVVRAEDFPREWWELHGYVGERADPPRAICAACRTTNEEIGVVYRHGPKVRAHLAHPPGMAPFGTEDHGETGWHISGKDLIAKWARAQNTVESVTPEFRLSDGSRRADLLVTMKSGARLAVEIQYSRIDEEVWDARHADYVRHGIRDLWLWHKDLLPFGFDDHPSRSLVVDVEAHQLGAIFKNPGKRDYFWWNSPPIQFVHHMPATDDEHFRSAGLYSALMEPLSTWALDPDGMIQPTPAVLARLDPDLTEVIASQKEAAAAKSAPIRPKRSSKKARHPAEIAALIRHEEWIAAGIPACRNCGYRLAPADIDAGEHVRC